MTEMIIEMLILTEHNNHI